jgi:hypothetical protein
MNLMMKIESVKSFVLLGTSLLVLAFAFFSSLLGTVGTIGEEWRTVAILEANPNSYMQWLEGEPYHAIRRYREKCSARALFPSEALDP